MIAHWSAIEVNLVSAKLFNERYSTCWPGRNVLQIWQLNEPANVQLYRPSLQVALGTLG